MPPPVALTDDGRAAVTRAQEHLGDKRNVRGKRNTQRGRKRNVRRQRNLCVDNAGLVRDQGQSDAHLLTVPAMVRIHGPDVRESGL